MAVIAFIKGTYQDTLKIKLSSYEQSMEKTDVERYALIAPILNGQHQSVSPLQASESALDSTTEFAMPFLISSVRPALHYMTGSRVIERTRTIFESKHVLGKLGD